VTNSRDGIREYLVKFAAEHEWAELWPKVMGARAMLLSQLVGVSEKQASWRPPSGDGEAAWSMVEVMQHVLTYTLNVTDIIEGTARGQDVAKDLPGAIAQGSEATLAGLLRAAVEASASLASIHHRLPSQPNTDITVPHVAFGDLNHRSWFLFLSWHDESHARQIAELKKATGFPNK
jgi:hypothetical protein